MFNFEVRNLFYISDNIFPHISEIKKNNFNFITFLIREVCKGFSYMTDSDNI